MFAIYFSIDQNPAPINTIEVRTAGSLNNLPAVILQTLRSVAPDLPVTEIVSLDTEFGDELSTERLLARLTGVFGVLALALAALGFYGLRLFRVARRASEIGIRMALSLNCCRGIQPRL
jgi:hypothetical protein